VPGGAASVPVLGGAPAGPAGPGAGSLRRVAAGGRSVRAGRAPARGAAASGPWRGGPAAAPRAGLDPARRGDRPRPRAV